MSNELLISTLRTAADQESNPALRFLLIMAAERIEELKNDNHPL
jgi:hypothetical protein